MSDVATLPLDSRPTATGVRRRRPNGRHSSKILVARTRGFEPLTYDDDHASNDTSPVAVGEMDRELLAVTDAEEMSVIVDLLRA